MDKKTIAGKLLSSGILMVVGSGLVAIGTKGVEEVTPIVVAGIKHIVIKK